MYGAEQGLEQEKQTDRIYLDKRVKAEGSTAAVLEALIKEGRGYMARGYLELAVQRFNQAWLLKPDDARIPVAFGDIYMAQKDHGRAIAMYERAIELNAADAMLYARAARLHQNSAAALIRAKDPKQNAAIDSHHDRALFLYDKASQLTRSDAELDRIYYSWAVALAMRGDFSGAWQKISLSRRHGGRAIEPDFLKKLSRDMPEPSATS